MLPAPVRDVLLRAYYDVLVSRFRARDEPDLQIVRYLLRTGDVAVDVGANIGVYTRHMAEVIGRSGRVVAIEPLDANFSILRFIARRHNWSNVLPLKIACSDVPGIGVMDVPLKDGGLQDRYRAYLVEAVPGTPQVGEAVRMVRLDDVVRRLAVEPTLVKIDVEGHEMAVLRGALLTIRRHRPALLVEAHGCPASVGSDAYRVHALLRDEGYRSFQWRDGELIEPPRGVEGVNYFFLTAAQQERLRGCGRRRVRFNPRECG